MSLEASEALELQLQAVVSHLLWALGNELRTSGRAEVLLIAEPSLQAPGTIFAQFIKETPPKKNRYLKSYTVLCSPSSNLFEPAPRKPLQALTMSALDQALTMSALDHSGQAGHSHRQCHWSLILSC